MQSPPPVSPPAHGAVHLPFSSLEIADDDTMDVEPLIPRNSLKQVRQNINILFLAL